jgi:excisionase family DNA binding protein
MLSEVVPIEAALTVEEAAEKIHYHPESLRRAIRQGRVAALRFGQGWRIPASELRRILATGLPYSSSSTMRGHGPVMG